MADDKRPGDGGFDDELDSGVNEGDLFENDEVLEGAVGPDGDVDPDADDDIEMTLSLIHI